MTKDKSSIYILLFLLLFPILLFGQQQHDLLNTPVKPTAKKGTIADFLKNIEQAGVHLTYSPDHIRMNRKITLSSNRYTVGELLQEILRMEDIQVKIYQDRILLIDAPKSITLSGIIKEEGSGEVIIGANVLEITQNKNAVSNGFGFYSITLEKGTHEFEITHIGHMPIRITVDFENESIRKDIFLKSGIDLPELKVTADSNSASLNLRGERVDLETAKKLPSFLGEKDVIRAVQLYAGVAGSTSNMVNMSVRGGNSDQNLVTLDDIPIYNINHLNGMFSIFNPDILKAVDFYRSDFPSKYGGRLSSVMNIRSKDGNMEHYHGHITSGLLYGSAGLEGPIIKNKASFSANFRRSWLDLISSKVFEPIFLKYYFTDLNLKLNYIANANNRFYFSGYLGNDAFKQQLDIDVDSKQYYRAILKWGNKLTAFRWNRILSPRLFVNTTATFSQYANSLLLTIPADTVFSQRIRSIIQDIGVKSDFNHYIRPGFKLNYGFGVNYNSFIYPLNTADEGMVNSKKTNTLTLNAYAESELKISPKIEFTVGAQYTGFTTKGTTYHSLQPRLRLLYRVGQTQSITASYSRMAQFVHQFTLNDLATPAEFRFPSNKFIKPETSEIFNLAYRINPVKDITLSVEGYYKRMNNLLALGAGQDIENGYFASNVEDRVVSGMGISKGIEFSYKQQLKWLRFQLAYTLSETTGKFDKLNLGKRFHLNQDFRHNFNVAVNSSLSKRLDFTAVFAYTTGRHATVPDGIYKNIDEVLGHTGPNDPSYYLISGINNYTLSNNYKIDLGLNLRRNLKSGRQRVWSMGVYNAIANPQAQRIRTAIDPLANKVIIVEENKLVLIPYFTFTYKF